jgi:hypothetical protein
MTAEKVPHFTLTLLIMSNLKILLKTPCTLHWWNMGKKTLEFDGTLDDLLKHHKITFTKSKSSIDGIYTFKFKSVYKITYTVRCTLSDFTHHAKQFIQMELVRMGDKATLYVQCSWRRQVTVNH